MYYDVHRYIQCLVLIKLVLKDNFNFYILDIAIPSSNIASFISSHIEQYGEAICFEDGLTGESYSFNQLGDKVQGRRVYTPVLTSSTVFNQTKGNNLRCPSLCIRGLVTANTFVSHWKCKHPHGFDLYSNIQVSFLCPDFLPGLWAAKYEPPAWRRPLCCSPQLCPVPCSCPRGRQGQPRGVSHQQRLHHHRARLDV